MSRKLDPSGFRYEVHVQRPGERARLISRHHVRGNADRRLLQLPMQAGEIFSIYEDGVLVRTVRLPAPGDLPEIPF
ncbi:hypothetical protein [Bosea sp. Root381]|uniref:hypothetical protein n=1 Tax=Bosea sp. Root381 TaxID=1736524 RepID=UPI000A93BC88|nr:hypothetical protein [Bosea sp. Root381]